jgi:hypothetical protein
MRRNEAIQAAAEELRQEIEAEGDVTGSLATTIKSLAPSKAIPAKQAAAIKHELMDAARDAADNF